MIKFAKLKDSAVIPSKEEGNAGYDIYACFEEDYMKLPAHKTILVPTGICSSSPNTIYMQMFNRGSNGSRGLLQACGAIDPNYRGEWFVAMTNTNKKDYYICKKDKENQIKMRILTKLWNKITGNKTLIYPYEKAICQFMLLEIPNEEIKEVTLEEIKNDKTKRGEGKLGSSGK